MCIVSSRLAGAYIVRPSFKREGPKVELLLVLFRAGQVSAAGG